MRDGWTETTFGVLAQVTSGFAFSTNSWRDEGIPVVKINTVRDGRVSLDKCSYISEPIPDRASKFLLKKGDLLITLTGEIGAIGFVSQSQPMYLNQRVGLVKVRDTRRVSLKFLGLFLTLPQVRAEMWSQGKGNAQLNISPNSIHSLNVDLPPLSDQERMVDLISSVDSYIEALQRYLESAKESRNAVLHELLTAGGDGWVETTLDKVSESSWGNTETTKSKYIKSGYLAYSATGADGFLDWYDHDGTAVVLSAIGAQCGKTWFAEGKWTSIKNTIWLKSDNLNLLDKYLFYLSNRPQFWQTRGQAQPFISLGDVKKTKVILPPIPEQKRIIEILSTIDDMVNDSERTLEESKNLRSGLLFDLLSGEREIPASYDKFIGAAR